MRVSEQLEYETTRLALLSRLKQIRRKIYQRSRSGFYELHCDLHPCAMHCPTALRCLSLIAWQVLDDSIADQFPRNIVAFCDFILKQATPY